MHKLDDPRRAVVFEVVGHDRSLMLAKVRFGSVAAVRQFSI